MADVGGRIVWDLDVDSSRFRRGLAEADSQARNFGSRVSNYLSNSVAASQQFARGLLAVGAAFSVVAGFAIKSAEEFQQNRIAFETMLGSAEKARKLLKQVSDFAAKTPFELPQVVNGAKQLLAYGIEAENLLPTFQALGNIAAGVGRERLPQLILAFGQVRAATRLMGTELRQFTEAGVPLLEVLAEQSGTTAGAIKKAMEDGAGPSFEEVRDALFSLSEEGGKFFNLMERQSKTFGGRMSNIRDQIGRLARDIVGISDTGDIREGSIFARLSDAAERLLNFLNTHGPQIREAILNAFDFIERNGPVIIGIILGGLVPAVIAAAGAFATWALTMAPWFALGAAVGLLIKNWPAIFSRAQKALQPLINGFVVFWAFIQPFREFIAGLFMDAWNDLKQAFDNVRAALQPWLPQLKQLAALVGGAVLLVIVAFIAGLATIITVAARLISWLAKLFGQFLLGVSIVAQFIRGVINLFNNLPGMIIRAIGNIGGLLYNVGRNMIQGLINGMGSLLGRIGQFMVERLPKAIQGPFKRALGISSPSKVFAGYGEDITAGLIAGLRHGQEEVSSMVSGLGVSSSPLAIDNDFTGAAASGPVTVNLKMDGIMTRSRADLRDVAKDMIKAVNEELRAKQQPEIAGGTI